MGYSQKNESLQGEGESILDAILNVEKRQQVFSGNTAEHTG